MTNDFSLSIVCFIYRSLWTYFYEDSNKQINDSSFFFMSNTPDSETLLIKWLDLNKELKEQDNLFVKSSFSYHFHNK